MNKRKAIKLLQNQKQIFIDRSYPARDVWQHKTSSLVKDFCGNDSDEYEAMINFEFGIWSNNVKDEWIKHELDRRRTTIIGLIDNCIDKIKRNGVQSSSKADAKQRNDISNKQIMMAVGILTLLVAIIVGWDEIVEFYYIHIKPFIN
jgi:hypothetical protein